MTELEHMSMYDAQDALEAIAAVEEARARAESDAAARGR